MTLETSTPHWSQGYKTISNWDGTTTTTFDYALESVTRNKAKTPGYPNVALRPLPYSCSRIVHVCGDYSRYGSYYNPLSGETYVYNETGTYYIGPQFDNWWRNRPDVGLDRLLTQSANDANQAVKAQQMNVGLAVGEAHQTIAMISKRIGSIASAARNLRRGRVSSALKDLGLNKPSYPMGKRLSKMSARERVADKLGTDVRSPSPREFADSWLELQFGWRPLVNDCVDALKVMDSRLSQRPAYCFATGRKKGSVSDTIRKVDKVEMSEPGKWLTQWIDRSDNVTAVAVTGYCFTITNPAIAALQQLGLSNAPALAWEATPFSFVLDWFVNVGQVIDSMDAWYGKDFVYGYQTTHVVTESTMRPGARDYSSTPGIPSSVSVSVSGAKCTWIETQRTVLQTPRPSQFVLSIPLTTWHGATSISLLTQLFK